jgi:hypothetical protein
MVSIVHVDGDAVELRDSRHACHLAFTTLASLLL